MTYDLYIDVLFLINFLMDFLLLNILKSVMNLRTSYWKLAAAGVFGAVWVCVLSIWPYIPWWAERFLTWAVIGCLMVKIAFPIRNTRELLKMVAALYLTATALGGVLYALDIHTNAVFYIRRLLAGESAEAMPLFLWTFLIAGGYFGVRYMMMSTWKIRREKNNFYQVTLCYRGKEETVTAYLDTGNRLREPVTKTPVHILTYEEGIKICGKIPSFIYIPFSSIGTKMGMLPGIFMDSMTVEKDGETVTIEKPLVAIVKQPLSPDGTYQMLLNEKMNEKTRRI
ncbi:sigma-E processing peptidase SpoIIGA [Clostridium sp. AM58-1XD]|uniref:sigma-E processing peptidase SpoIIGA n=1 Tax=Clostridium sp. AM58-1XD TaxID=2292307 RepID=UPI000E4995A2|nr:sigma-E processing peptidase SpoIIGA [Clostridium sp. AM58-1XD]RGY96922.1 peptidase U4 sporulation factor SpoIIGA [Clostridium sp. AM58-1XD]